ncbi:MAG TPA: type II secretion system protein [Terriglobia bacterium]|nr:type II secretion system protein [Terriglobia bacterium]
MELQGKPYNCPSRKRNNSGMLRGGPASSKNGYALLIVMMMATILLVSLTAALPNIYVQGQREREEELIFRGRQYARAIALFHQQFNRYPASVKELLHTNQMSFLRQAYRDPMSKSGEWRFIHATATGVILDSKILGSPGQQNTPNSGGSQTNPPKTGESTSGTASGQNTTGDGGFSLSGGQGTGTSSGQSGQGTQDNSMFGEKNQLIGAYIVGVASTSPKTAIRVFEGRTHYDEWEFLGVPGAPGGPAAAAAGGVPSMQEGQTPSMNQTPQTNSNQNSQPNSIFGGGSNPP